MGKESIKLIANNKKAYHDYFIEDTYEAGISLAGTEVKSMRMGKCSLKESFIKDEKGELFIYGMHISPYEKGNIFNKDPLRVRKLLMHRYEINKIMGKVTIKGYPLPAFLMPALWNALLVGWELTVYIGDTFALNAVYVAIGEVTVLLILGSVLFFALRKRHLEQKLF